MRLLSFITAFFSHKAETSNRTYKPAAIPARYRGKVSKELCRFVTSFEHLQKSCDIVASNRAQIAASQYKRELNLQRERDKKCVKKTATKIARVNEPLDSNSCDARLHVT